jgi:uncharacterized protein YrrD
MLRPVRKILGFTVNGLDADVGKIHDLYFDDNRWGVRYFIVDTGTWLSGRRVLVAPVAVQSVNWESKIVHVDLTRQQVEESPPIDLALPVSSQEFANLHEYYNWPPYWAYNPALGSGYGYAFPYPAQWSGPEEKRSGKEAQEEEEGQVEKGDPHLRSVREVLGYHIYATDGPIGHVDDFFVDEGSWLLHYLLVETRDFLHGRKVVMSTDWVEDVSWAERTIYVRVTQDQVKESPAYNPPDDETAARVYEQELHDYYGFRGYWIRPS